MCFHISNTKTKKQIERRFDAMFDFPEAYEAYYHFNGFEKRNLYIIKQDDPELIYLSTWGLLPTNYDLSKRKEFLIKNNTLNATSERLFESPLFSKHIEYQKCLIIADGLYEPHKVEGVKGSFPYYFKHKDHRLFAFAGIYSEIESGETPIYSASIITREANSLFKKIHNSPNKKGSYRMPLILDKSDEYEWLNTNNFDTIKTLLHTFTKEEFYAHSVSKDVFSPKKISNREDILNKVTYL